MKCLYCQGEMKKRETPFHIDRNGCHLTSVSSECSETCFDTAEVDAVQDLIRAIEQHPLAA